MQSTLVGILALVALIVSVIQLICVISEAKHIDGKLVIDEAADSYTIHITTDPEEINRKDFIKLRIEKV